MAWASPTVFRRRITSVRKIFRFQKNSYLSQVSTEVTTDGKPVPHMIEWRGGFGDFTVANAVRQPADRCTSTWRSNKLRGADVPAPPRTAR